MIERACQWCEFWVPWVPTFEWLISKGKSVEKAQEVVAKGPSNGQCRRFPPSIPPDGYPQRTEFIRTGRDMWCGEFKKNHG